MNYKVKELVRNEEIQENCILSTVTESLDGERSWSSKGTLT